MEEEIYYQMVAQSGRTVRVPASKLKDWLKGQEEIKQGKEPELSEESMQKLSELFGLK